MRPDERDLDEEIRGYLALSVRERIERGEDPDAARLAALREFGYVPAIRGAGAPVGVDAMQTQGTLPMILPVHILAGGLAHCTAFVAHVFRAVHCVDSLLSRPRQSS
jgi:hypothetical protein